MRQLLMIFAIFFAFQAHAEIFKCKNDNGKITYQGTPCVSRTVGKINKASDVPIGEQIRAKDNINSIIETNRQHDEAIELERQHEEQQREENARRQEDRALENRRVMAAERQAAAAERYRH